MLYQQIYISGCFSYFLYYVYLKPTKSKGECEHCVEVGEYILLEQLANNLKAMQIPEEYLQAIKDSVKDNLEKNI